MVVRLLEAADAPALVACFARCYGTSYGDDLFYDPSAIRSELAAGRMRSVVAVTPLGEVVGHTGLRFKRGGPAAQRVAEAGGTVVDPAHRGRGLLARLGSELRAARPDSLLGYVHYPVTTHEIMQKAAVRSGGVETGVMLDYSPAGTDDRGSGAGPAPHRAAVVIVYQPFRPAPAREVFVPSRYRDEIETTYREAQLERSFGAIGAIEPGARTELAVHFHPRRRLLHLELETAGDDLVAGLERELDRARSRGASSADVAHLDIALSAPTAPAAVEQARRAGFFYSGLFPEFGDGDVLRLQALIAPEAPAHVPELAGTRARALLQRILADRED